MNLLNKKLSVETIKRIVKERNRILGAIYRKMDTDQGRAHKSPLLKLRKRYVISLAQLSQDTGINYRTQRSKPMSQAWSFAPMRLSS